MNTTTLRHRLVARLLRRNISAGQLIGYAAANLVGLAIVLTALQFYRDVTTAETTADSFISEDYLIISKQVSGLGSIAGGAVDFSADEIEALRRAPWAAEVGQFTAADFDVFASVDFGGRRMATSMFLEAIPDDFFDISPSGWQQWQEGGAVPIVISKDYLTLYNFGYAPSRGLPQISEAMVGMVPLQLSLSGNGRQQTVPARIVGFSSRLNTIAVPQRFLDDANATYGSHKSVAPSRLIVKLKRSGDPEATAYMEAHGYDIAGDKVNSGRAAYFLRIITSVVIAVGLVISLLAFFILLLSIYLLLQKNRDKIHQLMQLGYTPGAVARVYYLMVARVNAIVLILAGGSATAAHLAWSTPLRQLGLSVTTPWLMLAVAVVLVLLITLGNFWAISRKVRAAFRI